MRALIQRVNHASVQVKGKCIGEIETGVLLLLGIAKGDNNDSSTKLAEKVLNYRIFPDEQGRMNRSLVDIKGALLVVSQFTLCADTQKGLRPSFSSAAPPDLAQKLYLHFVDQCANTLNKVETGEFGADMKVSLLNDGPVTFLLES
ncbi:MAG: D-tyrosyl-tRNA(Tyr) deacylase [Porticoccaceae bacterium]|jgi:D-aminoacyl-tRNA deacylase|nr:D-tyrosyl-tRNA(Tyr) deacylase [Porticoccaceae bacterium]